MKQFVKTLAAMLLIAMCLTSDTALTSTAATAQYLSTNYANCGSSGPRLLYWEHQSWTPLQVTSPCVYPLP